MDGRITIVVEAMAGAQWADVPPVVRLRAALKRLGRDYGLRCVTVHPEARNTATTDEKPDPGAQAPPGSHEGDGTGNGRPTGEERENEAVRPSGG